MCELLMGCKLASDLLDDIYQSCQNITISYLSDIVIDNDVSMEYVFWLSSALLITIPSNDLKMHRKNKLQKSSYVYAGYTAINDICISQ